METKKILIPIDFSDCSKNALKNAVHLAKKTDAGLLLVHAFNVPVPHVEIGASALINELASGIEKDIKKDFEKLGQEIPGLSEVPYEFITQHAFVKDAISTASVKNHIDLVIMGTHGAKGIDEVLLGSNTYATIRGAKHPILAIPPEKDITNIKRIALACDYKSIDDKNMLNPLIDLATVFNAEIDIMHISKDHMLSPQESSEAKMFEQVFKNIKHSYHFDVNENIEEGIQQYITNNNIDLLVLIPHEHNLFERLFKTSVTKKMVFHSKVPFMTLPN